MTGRILLFSISALLGSIAFGEPLPDASSTTETATEIQAPAGVETPPELTEAIREQDAAVKTLEQQDTVARTALRDWYASSIETMRQDAVTQGNLDHVVALDLERQRMDTEITPEEKAKLFYTLRELRGRFDRERADQMRHATAAVRVGLQRYAVALDQLAGIFLQHGNVGAARVVERARLSMLGAAPTSAFATSYSSTGSSTAGSGSTATSGSSASSAKASAAKPTFAGSSTVQVKGSVKVASVVPANPPAKGKKDSGSEKPVVAKSGPTATSVSAPSGSKVAKETTKKAAPSSSGKGAPASKAVATRSSGSGAPAGGGRTSGGGGGGAVIVVR